jgi:uncharacterized RDD family membrane protein YckC
MGKGLPILPDFTDPMAFEDSFGYISTSYYFILLLNILIPSIYEGLMVGKFGATLGKMALGLKVVDPDGGKISYPLAFGRYFAKFISGFILGFGYLMVAFDSEKRGLHDMICRTRVVKRG